MERPIVLYYIICGCIVFVFLSRVGLAIAQGAIFNVYYNSLSTGTIDWDAYNQSINFALGVSCVWSFYLIVAIIFVSLSLGAFAWVLHKKEREETTGRTDGDVDIKLLVAKARIYGCSFGAYLIFLLSDHHNTLHHNRYLSGCDCAVHGKFNSALVGSDRR